MRPFSLHRRNGSYYCRWWNPTTKSYTGAKSTRERDKDRALAKVYYWEQNGFGDSVTSTIEEHGNIDTILKAVRSAPLSDQHVAQIIEMNRPGLTGVCFI